MIDYLKLPFILVGAAVIVLWLLIRCPRETIAEFGEMKHPRHG